MCYLLTLNISHMLGNTGGNTVHYKYYHNSVSGNSGFETNEHDRLYWFKFLSTHIFKVIGFWWPCFMRHRTCACIKSGHKNTQSCDVLELAQLTSLLAQGGGGYNLTRFEISEPWLVMYALKSPGLSKYRLLLLMQNS